MAETRDPLSHLGRLKPHLEAELSDHDVDRLVHGGIERRQRRRIRRTLMAGLVIGAASTILVVLSLQWAVRGELAAPRATVASSPPSSPTLLESARPPQVISLNDESRVTALVRETQVVVDEDTPERIRLRLDRGRARFQVTRLPQRSFSVRAGSVTVGVVGTTFSVEVVADRVGVSVEHGEVEVDWTLGRKRLLAGENGWFPPLVLEEQSQAPEPGRREQQRDTPASADSSARSAGSSNAVASSAQQLLAEVDAARSRGQAERAVELLQQILREHPDDPRATLAAFTLGRMLLNELGRPREAAAAFHRVRQKAAAGQFAEDALAREVEAWTRASEPERARQLALLYLEHYPAGRHARRIKVLAGL